MSENIKEIILDLRHEMSEAKLIQEQRAKAQKAFDSRRVQSLDQDLAKVNGRIRALSLLVRMKGVTIEQLQKELYGNCQ